MNLSPVPRVDAHERWIWSVLRAVEQIALCSINDSHRVIGFTSPEPMAGVSTVARSTAEVFARAGFKTLLIDLTAPIQPTHVGPHWPGRDEVKKCISHREGTSDRLIARPTPSTASTLNNVEAVRQALAVELAEYARVVIDMPAILAVDDHRINPVAAAAACDCVILVCVRGGVTQERLSRALQMTRAAGANITGIVLNDRNHSTVGVDLARLGRRLFRWAPRIADWIERRALESELLN